MHRNHLQSQHTPRTRTGRSGSRPAALADHRSLTTNGQPGRPGGYGGGPAPDPIPNSAVKPPSAHGTVAQATGE